MTSHPGQQLTLGLVEPLICDTLPNIKSAFMVLDSDGTGLVKKEEFRRVLKSHLSVSQNQLDTFLDEVRLNVPLCPRGLGQFLLDFNSYRNVHHDTNNTSQSTSTYFFTCVA